MKYFENDNLELIYYSSPICLTHIINEEKVQEIIVEKGWGVIHYPKGRGKCEGYYTPMPDEMIIKLREQLGS